MSTEANLPVPPPATAPSARRGAWALVGALALLWLLASQPLWRRGEFYAEYDLREQVYPWRLFASVALGRGELGQWNPWLARGYPHLGEGQAGILHPAHLLAYRALPAPLALALETTLYYPFALLGLALFLRRSLGVGWPAALFGGGVFAFSTFMVAHYPHVNMVWVFAHTPWLLLCLERTFRGGRPALAAAGVAVTFASMLLLGHPQAVWLAGVVTGLALLWLLARPATPAAPPTARIRARRLAFTGLLAGALIGLLQVLPTLDYLRHAPRALPAYERANYSLHPLNLVIQVAPTLFRDKYVADVVQETPARRVITPNPQEWPTYLGLGLLLLNLTGLVFYRDRWRGPARGVAWGGAAAALLCLLLMLGQYGPLLGLTGYLPIVAQFHCPIRYLAVLTVLQAVYAGLVAHWLATAPPTRWPERGELAVLLAPLALSLLVAGVALALTARSPDAVTWLPFQGERLGLALARPALLLRGPLLATITLALLLLYLRARQPAVLATLLIVCVADVAAYAFPLPWQAPRRTWGELAAARARLTGAEHPYRRVAGVNEPMLAGRYLANGYLGLAIPEPLILQPDTAPAAVRSKEAMQADQQRLVTDLRLAAVDEIVAEPTLIPFPPALRLPRLRLVPRLAEAADPLAAARTADLATIALVAPGVAAPLEGPPLAADETVAFVADRADTVSVRVQVAHPRVLVLADRCWPGWRVAVDGQPRALLPLFAGVNRGVLVGPGDREVVFAYRDAGLARAVPLAGFGLAVLCGLLILDLRTRPWRRR